MGTSPFEAINGGVINTLGPVTLISTSPSYLASGARAETGGTITLNGGTITAAASGIFVGANSLVTATGMNITTTVGSGVYAEFGGQANLFGGASDTTISTIAGGLFSATNGPALPATVVSLDASSSVGKVTIHTTGDFSAGAAAWGNTSNATVDLKGAVMGSGYSIVIVTDGSYAYGVGSSGDNATALASGVDVTTNGIGAYGLRTSGAGSTLTANNVNVTTTGGTDGFQSANAVVAEFSGELTLNGPATITTTGTSGIGLLSQVGGAPGMADTVLKASTATGAINITTTGGQAHGAMACSRIAGSPDCIDALGGDIVGPGSRAILDMQGVEISTSGSAAFGIVSFGEAAFVEAKDVSVATSGADAHGTVVRNGATLEASDSTIEASGANGGALYMTSPAGTKGHAVFSNSTLASLAGPAIQVAGGNAEATFDASSVVGNSVLLDVRADGANVSTMEMRANASSLTGSAHTEAGSTSNLSLANNTLWNVTGDSNVTTLLNDSSVIAFQAGGSFKTLTTDGDYTGANGLIVFNTVLGDDASLTDLLAVKGNSMPGLTHVKVVNQSGAGAQTVNGIKIVDVGGVSNGQFVLDGDYMFEGDQAVIAGAYAYRLFQGGVATPTDGDWYLRSTLSTNPATPHYQAGAPVFEAYPQVLLGLNGLPTLQQRVGNRYWSGAGAGVISEGADAVEEKASAPEDATTFIEGRGLWGRIEALHTSIDPDVSTSRTDYDYDIYKLQAGLDLLLRESDAGTLIGGLTVHYGHASADISSRNGNGDISADGYGFGGTLTWYGNNGFYLDGQAQVSWYDSNLHSDILGGLADSNDGFGYALSLESGKRIDLDNDWTTTPQAQLVYSSVDFDDFTQMLGGRNIAGITLGDGDSLRGRLGITLDREASWQADDGTLSRRHVYGIANLHYEFLDGTRVNVAGTDFFNRSDRLWGEIGFGGSYNWGDDKFSIYGEGSVSTGLADFGDSYGLKGIAGFRVKW